MCVRDASSAKKQGFWLPVFVHYSTCFHDPGRCTPSKKVLSVTPSISFHSFGCASSKLSLTPGPFGVENLFGNSLNALGSHPNFVVSWVQSVLWITSLRPVHRVGGWPPVYYYFMVCANMSVASITNQIKLPRKSHENSIPLLESIRFSVLRLPPKNKGHST